MDKLAIITVATKGYQYALKAHARAIKQNVMLAGIESGHFIIATDLEPIPGILAHYKALLGDGWQIHHLPLPVSDDCERYKVDAQLLIATLFNAAFDKARELDAGKVWTVEADVIPNPNNLACMLDMLRFDNGYYGVAFVPYVSSGGGGIMGGRGTPQNHILPNVYEDEFNIPAELAARMKAHEAARDAAKIDGKDGEAWIAEATKLNEEIKACPPKGNVFALNATKWRKRGWLDYAAPAIGKGAALESDWQPMGNNVFSRKAFTLLDFSGYEGKGTQDLYSGFLRLAPHGIKFCVIPHCTSNHVVKRKDGTGNIIYKMLYLYHETQGDCIGHLRQREIDWREM